MIHHDTVVAEYAPENGREGRFDVIENGGEFTVYVDGEMCGQSDTLSGANEIAEREAKEYDARIEARVGATRLVLTFPKGIEGDPTEEPRGGWVNARVYLPNVKAADIEGYVVGGGWVGADGSIRPYDVCEDGGDVSRLVEALDLDPQNVAVQVLVLRRVAGLVPRRIEVIPSAQDVRIREALHGALSGLDHRTGQVVLDRMSRFLVVAAQGPIPCGIASFTSAVSSLLAERVA